MTTLLSARDIRVIADSLGVRPTKQRGQNFVIDPNTVRMIVSAAKLAEGEEHTVLEVGPGLGSLTLGLLEVGHRVIAVEIDELLASRLPDTVAQFAGADAPFELICADALDVAELSAAPDALIANLPYNVAVPVLLHLLAQFDSIKSVLVMVQKEVADRLAAPPGSRTYGVPSVKAQWYGTVEQAGRIGRSVFWPAPNVDSGLVRITRHAEPRTADRDAVFRVVDTAFAQRRKTLRAALSGWAGSGAAAEEILTAAGVDPKARGEVLTVDDFIRIAEARTAARGAAGQPAADGQSAARDSAGQPAADGQPTAGAAAET